MPFAIVCIILKERFADKKLRAARIIQGLEATYPQAHCELNYSNPLELLVATVLSAQCNDRQVNIVTEELFKKYRTARAYAESRLEELESQIRRIGLFRNKAKNIQAACRALLDKHKGEVPRTMAELIELPGVGRKTANVVLGNAFEINEGIVVDTHVIRLSRRLALSGEGTPEKIETDLQQLVPQKGWTIFSHLLIWHGRRRCYARMPDCPNCEIKKDCPTAQKVLNPKLTAEQQTELRKRV
jgi:endonuclease-3